MTVTDPAQLKAPKRVRLVSATELIGRILPKPLVPWAERQTTDGMLTLHRAGELHPDMTVQEALDAMREARIGAEGVRNTAARRGIGVHELAELVDRYVKSGTWADPVGILDVDDYKYAHALNDWLSVHRPEPHQIEELVCDPGHGWAGRFDLCATIDGQRTLVDYATSEKAAIWPSKHWQIRMYERGRRLCGDEPADRLLIVVFAKDGTWRQMDCLATDRAVEDSLRYYRGLKPVTKACDDANRIEKDKRAEPSEPKPDKIEQPWESAPDHPDPAHRPGAFKDYRRRELLDGSLVEFEAAPAGWTTKDGKRRQRDWRAYWLTPPVQAQLPVAEAA